MIVILPILPKLALFEILKSKISTAPLKLAVLPDNSKLIVILLLVIFDVTLKLPVRFASLLEITSTLATPLLLIITSPFAVGISTLLVPLLIDAPLPDAQVKFPAPSVCKK